MKKNIGEIIDGMTPEEIGEIIEKDDFTNEAEDIDVSRITTLSKQKSGIKPDCAIKKRKKFNTKRVLLIAACIALVSSFVIGTAAVMNRRSNRNRVNEPVDGEITVITAGGEYDDGVIGGGMSLTGKKDGKKTLRDVLDGIIPSAKKGSEMYYSAEVAAESADSGKRKYDEAAEAPDAAPGEYDIPYEGKTDENSQFRAGTLTASEWKDLKADNFGAWKELLADKFSGAADTRRILTDSIVPVYVDFGGSPVFNCKVELLDATDKVLYTSVTDVNGNAWLLYNVRTKDETPAYVRIGEQKTAIGQNPSDPITLNAAEAGVGVTALDLMLMIDTTGSMGDELRYLQVELRDMIRRIAENGQTVSIRVSVNFYRDEGDEYIVKYYDFRTDIAECVEQIGSQQADGGGDYPEAVHTALDNAVNGHKWRDEAVKICFIVLDAPPHSENEIQGINSQLEAIMKTASGLGIRMIPVASSGVDTETEYLLRSFAVMTGGTYVFLTDDSGYGGSHLEASVGETKVEKLNECMIRIVSEYCGIKYTEQ